MIKFASRMGVKIDVEEIDLEGRTEAKRGKIWQMIVLIVYSEVD